MGYYIKAEEDVNLFVEDLGPKEGRVIFFIHGWPVNHKMFEYQMNQLPRLGFRCIAMDIRGFGKSDRPWTGYSYDRLADDVRAVIDSLQLKEITLAGFSMGGAIAIRYMARHGEHQVSKLALFGAAAPSFTKRPDYPYGISKSEVNKLIDQTFKDRPEMLAGFGQIFFSKYLTDSFKNWFQNLGLEGSGHGTALTAVSLRDEDLRLDLGKINVTTAIFHGMKDLICPFIFAKLMNEGIKDSEIIPFKYSGHGLFYDELEKFNRELVRFLE
ncbi:alpha/beta fold hydrolase [Bacillus sp. V2I10]|uniref:alpha/beta fold hydrolase n=1 Tax=Bacillus sp. V2I10 TaxID=3042276 RepID=UPI0027880EF9|nr:alpha/beta hydrolase [Bacillus sp. V2I10]MDQ0858789.1 non-heme chloroperoxidase [Bacillus sp. V2I10]